MGEIIAGAVMGIGGVIVPEIYKAANRKKITAKKNEMNQAAQDTYQEMQNYYLGEASTGLLQTERGQAMLGQVQQMYDDQNNARLLFGNNGMSEQAKAAQRARQDKNMSDMMANMAIYDAENRDKMMANVMSTKDQALQTKLNSLMMDIQGLSGQQQQWSNIQSQAASAGAGMIGSGAKSYSN